jgi:hypothetical protein
MLPPCDRTGHENALGVQVGDGSDGHDQCRPERTDRDRGILVADAKDFVPVGRIATARDVREYVAEQVRRQQDRTGPEKPCHGGAR